MLLSSWLPYSLRNSPSWQHLAARQRSHWRHPRLPSIALLVEALESRQLLTDIFVTTTVDSIIPDSDTSLREAILQARGASDPVFIFLGNGVFTLTIGGTSEDAGAAGDLDVFNPNNPVTIVGAGHDQTTIDGGGLDRVFHILSGAVVQIENLTIQGGQAGPGESGGGLRNDGDLTLRGVHLRANFANSNLGSGGGIFNSFGSALNVEGSRLEMNQAKEGGAAIFNSGTATITGSLVIGNSQPAPNPGTASGALANVGSSAQMTVIGSEVVGNVGNLDVGGLHNLGGTVEIFRSTFNNNVGATAGGVFNQSGGTFILNSTFANNRGNVSGALLNNDLMDVVHATVVDNSSPTGTGGIVAAPGATTHLWNSIVARSITNGSLESDLSGTFQSLGTNLIGNVGTAAGLDPGQGDQLGTSVMPLDPRLSPLGDHSRSIFTVGEPSSLVPPMLTFLPLLDSPTIDAANPVEGPQEDQYGHPRPVFAGIAFAPDIGSVERTFGTIRGQVFDDLNGNGERDDGEPGIDDAGLHLSLSPLQPGVEPDSQPGGQFKFAMLPQPSTLYLAVNAPFGFLPPTAPVGVAEKQETNNGLVSVNNTIAVGDVNDDGLQDLVFGGSLGGRDAVIDIRLMSSEGSFGDPNLFTISGASDVLAVALADLDGVNGLDLVATVANQVLLFANDGEGNFSGPVTVVSGIGAAPRFLVTGDFNADGNLDFAIADPSTGILQIQFLDGTFGVSGGLQFVQGGLITSLLAGPNGELLLTNAGLGTVSIFHVEQGGLAEDLTIAGMDSVQGAAVEDFLGDGNPDLVVATQYGLHFFMDFQQQGPSPIESFIHELLADGLLTSDFDHDSLADLVIGNSEGIVSLLTGESILALNQGALESPSSFSRPFGVNPTKLALIDIPRGGEIGSESGGSDLVGLGLDGSTFKILVNTSGTIPIDVFDAAETTFDVPLVRAASLNGQVQLTGGGLTTQFPNVKVYIDRNQNNRLDDGEVFAISMQDDLETAADEAGRFSLFVHPGDVTLRIDAPEGHSILVPSKIDFDNAYDLTVSANAIVTDLDFLLEIPVPANSAPTTPVDVDTHVNSIPEGALNGSRIGITLEASDPNEDTVFYRLTDDAGGRFAIDPLTGVVTVKDGQLLKFADAALHTIRAAAIDALGNVSLESAFVVSVTQVPADALPLASILPIRVDVVEGDAGPNFITFLVKLNKPSTKTITIDFSTRLGSDPTFLRPEGITEDLAFASDQPGAGDFFRSAGRLTFDPGVTEQSLRVQIRSDDLPEANELFFVQLQSPVNARLATQQSVATARILDDDSVPQLIVSNTQSVEGATPGQRELVFRVELIGNLPPGIPSATTEYVTGNIAIDTAIPGTDYSAVSDTLTFTNVDRVHEVSVPIIGNLDDEADKSVSLRFENPVNLGLSRSEVTGTIINDDSPQVRVGIAPTVFKIRENNSGSQQVEFIVTLIGKPTADVSVSYATANDTATAGSDYTAASGTLDFTLADITAGNIQQSIFVTVIGDTRIEPDETFTVGISLPSSSPAEVSINPDLATGKVVIRSDDQVILLEDGDALALALSDELTALLGAGPKNNPELLDALRARALEIIRTQGLTKAIVLIIDPVDFVLTDPEGRQAGYSESTGVVNNIPGTYYSGDGAVELLIVPLPPDGTYNVQLAGLGGDFNASITVLDSNGTSTNIVSQSLGDGATSTVAFQVGENRAIPVGMSLAANAAAPAVGVVGAWGNAEFRLALASALEQAAPDGFDLDGDESLSTGLMYWLTVSARATRQQILEPLWESLGAPLNGLLGDGLLTRRSIPSEFVDHFWSQIGQSLTGVPASIYRLGDLLENLLPTLMPSRNRTATPRASIQGQPNVAPKSEGVKVRRSSSQRPSVAPQSPPARNSQAAPANNPEVKKDNATQSNNSQYSNDQQSSTRGIRSKRMIIKDNQSVARPNDRRST